VTRGESRRVLALLLVATVFVGLIRMLLDRDPLAGGLGLAWPDAQWRAFRMTATATALLTGAMLGVAGMLLQAALRNPLASPSVLGVSSGAGLGVMAALFASYHLGVGAPPWSVPALAGAATAVLVVVLLGRRHGWPDPVSTILAGVIVATMCGAGMVLLQGLVPDGLRGRFLAWALGTVPELVPRGAIPAMAALLGVGALWSWINHGRLDALLLDHASAEAIGARPGPARLGCLVLAGILTAVTVAICGPLGFVGLVAPHVARLMVGPAHRTLLPATLLCGAMLVCGADVLRQAIDLGSGRLPVGVLTTLGGGPLFLWLLRRGAGSDWRGGRDVASM
jgi:iron complex transport system permease protein